MGVMHKLWYAGECSMDYGLYISGDQAFDAPERDVENIQIDGRNGDLIIDKGRYKNITIAYPCFIRDRFRVHSGNARAWLCAPIGYQRLEDTYNRDYFRQARFYGPLNFDVHLLRAGECEITFDCKPQRFLKSGEYPVEITAGALHNPTRFPALPLIKVYGTAAGNLNISGTVVQIKSIASYVMIDSDTQNAYKGTENKNGTIVADAFPVLKPGANPISWSGGITRVEITPRWWTL